MTVSDIAGQWIDTEWKSGLIECCRQYWTVPIRDVPNGALAIYLRQGIALSVTIPEARRRIEIGFEDGSEMLDEELINAINHATRAQPSGAANAG